MTSSPRSTQPLIEARAELGRLVHEGNAALPPASGRLDDHGQAHLVDEATRLGLGGAEREARRGQTGGGVARAHCVFLLAATHRLGVGVERQPEPGGHGRGGRERKL
ncbi:MAG: hypothetical protein MUF34_03585, partial [Polyangiaceae bacterium]|nr:hypothetical protein [Polyangiaceae bacterium]